VQLEEEVAKRTVEIVRQKDIIDTKNEEILWSISYAKCIQSAILPDNSVIDRKFVNYFILYKPKDIVAGDFYWLDTAKIDGKEITLLAAADCTGHGVPGAMVSVVCSGALHAAVREYSQKQPACILDKTLELVLDRFQSSEDEVKDGMDIALIGMHPVDRNGDRQIEFAGAQNPLWLVTTHERKDIQCHSTMSENGIYLYEIKGDKQPIGKYGEPKPFTNHSIKAMKGDMIYLFTDGYADQFGGPRGKKFKYKTMKSALISMHGKAAVNQKNKLEAIFEDWRADLEQVDDVCVIGVRI